MTRAIGEANGVNSGRPLSPRGRGREAMTYGRGCNAAPMHNLKGAAVSHLAELVRGY